MKLIIACTYIFLSCEETFPLREGNFSSQGRKLFLSSEERGRNLFLAVYKKKDAHSN